MDKRIAVMLGLMALVASPVAQPAGHGPAFVLATPTLGQGQWSSDTSVMVLDTETDTGFMGREWIGWGWTEDLQLTLGFPLAPQAEGLRLAQPPRTRGMSMMGGFGQVEAGLLWRFHKVYPGGGQRRESTLIVNAGVPSRDVRGGIEVGPSAHVALTTGYASRSGYWWLGAGYERYFERGGDRLGDLPYLSAALGYRPAVFRRDYPAPDIRFFLELLAEFPEDNRRDGRRVPTGGTQVLLGPSVLGLFGPWGISAGVLFPVMEDLGPAAPEEDFRAVVDVVFWF